MAKYIVNYSCGHGKHEVQLVGKETERERKIEWMETSMSCPECFKAEQEKKNKAMGVVVAFGTTINPESTKIAVSVVGDTTPIKETLKTLGYTYGELQGGRGIMGLFDTSKAPWGWQKFVEFVDIQAAAAEVDTLKPNKIVNNISALDIEVLKMALAGKAERAAAAAIKKENIDSIEKPTRPGSYPAGRWNGTIYSGNRVYIDNKEEKLTEAAVVEIKKYQTEIKKYQEAVKTAKGE